MLNIKKTLPEFLFIWGFFFFFWQSSLWKMKSSIANKFSNSSRHFFLDFFEIACDILLIVTAAL